MAKKRKQILGPNGKPYVAPPKPPTERDMIIPTPDKTYFSTLTFEGLRSYFGITAPKAKDAGLAEAVAQQINALLPTDLDDAPAELPQPERDLTTYRDAYAEARKACNHQDAHEVIYQREWFCDACQRVLSRDEMRRAGALRWWM